MPEFEDDRPRHSPEDLLRVARYQRWVVAVMLAQLALWGGYVLLSMGGRGDLRDGMRFPMILTFILGGVGAIYSFLLYWTARGPILAVIMGVAALLPCMGLLVLLTVHGTATTFLKENGVRVGFFGADLDSIGDIGPLDDDDDAGW
jgi:hypothetical protein